MSMRTIALYVCLLMTCFVCGAREITIMPQFTVGDTIGYRATTSLVMYHGKDCLRLNDIISDICKKMATPI